MKIGLALSGGGFRATVFHLGVLARLAEDNRLEEISFLSTVSGGSLCVGLIYAQNAFHWPASQVYLREVLPAARRVLTTEDLQSGIIRRVIRSPFNLRQTRADDLSALMKDRWGVTALMSELPSEPRWLINTTCYETGRNWRFERLMIGDYVFGYSSNTQVPVSDAMAASAGFPGLIGALSLNTASSEWFKFTDSGETPEIEPASHRTAVKPIFPTVHLWDGGLYDNLGLEALHNFTGGWRQGVDFLIASDGSGKAGIEEYKVGAKAAHRITDLLMDQVRSLRSRAILERMVTHQEAGVFLRIGNSCEKVLTAAGKTVEAATFGAGCLSPAEAKKAEDFSTTIRRLTEGEFELLFRNGFEVADYTLYGFHGNSFAYRGYKPYF